MADLNNTKAGTAITGTLVSKKDLRSLIGEGVHVGLRKGSDAPSSGELWQAIAKSDDGAWSDAVMYAVWGLLYMGYAVVDTNEKKD